jgi:hypothetical protein
MVVLLNGEGSREGAMSAKEAAKEFVFFRA